MPFLSNQAAFGPPAEYTPRSQELEGKYQAYKDYVPDAAKSALSIGITNIAGKDIRHISKTDKDYVNSIKSYVDNQTSELQKRIDSGENPSNVYRSAAALKQQYHAATKPIEERADIQEQWDKDLKASGLLKDEADILRDIQYNNLEAHAKVYGYTPENMPVLPIAKPVNYKEIARKAMVEVANHIHQDDPSNTSWKQLIEVDPSKYQQVLRTVDEKYRQAYYDAFTTELKNDPEALKYLEQQASSNLFVAHQSGYDLRPEGADMRIGEMPDERTANAQKYIQDNKEALKQQLMNEKIHDVAYGISGTAAYKNITFQDKVLSSAVEEAKILNQDYPGTIYENSPAVDFSSKKVTNLLKPGDLAGATYVIPGEVIGAEGEKTRTIKTEPVDYNKLSQEKKNHYDKLAVQIDPILYNKLKDDTATDIEKQTLNKKISDVLKNIQTETENIKIGTIFKAYPLKTAENLTKIMFGTTSIKDAKLSGNFINRYFYDTENHELFTGKQLQPELDEGLILVTGESSGENPYVILGSGIENFADARQVSINGKQYVMTGPHQEFRPTSDEKGVYDITQEKRNINTIYNTKLLGTTETFKLNDKSIDINYNENKKLFIAKTGTETLSSNSASNLYTLIILKNASGK